jgi:ABC-type dipeptide/oligopeptide/nickel transport system permease component
MGKYLLRRSLQTIPVLVGVSVLVFLMLYLTPGDPVQAYLADKTASPERVEALRRQLGLDKPAYVQYFNYVGHVLQGDLGRTLRSNSSVSELIIQAVPSTATLALAALVIAASLGMVLGVMAAVFRGTIVDTALMLLALLGVSMPVFWLALLMISLFSLTLGWFPITDSSGLQGLVLPAVCLGLLSSAGIARLTRSSMLEVLNQEYITTARSKGLSRRLVLVRHALKNSLIPVITVMGLQMGQLLGGAVITETVFARPGLGRLVVDGVLNKDFPQVQGTVLVIALIYVLVNLLVDVSYVWFDPRIRYS